MSPELTDQKRQALDQLPLASEYRRLAQKIGQLLGDAGMGQPQREAQLFKGEKYYEVFTEDVIRMMEKI